MEKITFYDESNGEPILFEVVDEVSIDEQKYILVVDEDDIAAILKEITQDNEEATYALIEDDEEFKKIAVHFMSSEDYDIEV